MNSVRRWYVYLACAISIQAVCWAIIALLRNILFDLTADLIALQCAVIIVGFPLFLAHWVSAQRLVQHDEEERVSPLRRLYLFVMLAAFLAPLLFQLYRLVKLIVTPLISTYKSESFEESLGLFAHYSDYLYILVALLVLGLFWYYHLRILLADQQAVAETEDNALIRSFYIYGFSAVSLAFALYGLINLIEWLFSQLDYHISVVAIGSNNVANFISLLMVFIPCWLFFWQGAQRLYRNNSVPGRASVMRQLYLYLVLFFSVVITVTSAVLLVMYLLQQLLQVDNQMNWRRYLAMILVMTALWIYQRLVLREDGEAQHELPQLANIRRGYSYLVASVGLLTFLIGLGGEISLLIQALDSNQFVTSMREQLAIFTAALLAGLPVWLLPWRSEQQRAVASDESNAADRRALVRKIYLYFFLFVSVITALSSMVYLLYQLLGVLFGSRTSGNLFSDIGHSAAFSLIAVVVWIYHARLLREDFRLTRQDEELLQKRISVAIINSDVGQTGNMLYAALQREFPLMKLQLIALDDAETAKTDYLNELEVVDIIIVPAKLLVSAVADNAITRLFIAVKNSPAEKLVLPQSGEDWNWLGLSALKPDELIREVLIAVRKMTIDENIAAKRPLSPAAIVAIVFGVILLIPLILTIIGIIFSMR